MGTLTASLFVSLDSYATDAQEEMLWVTSTVGPEKSAFDHDIHVSADVLVMGRVTYDIMVDYWPQADAEDKLTSVMNNTPKVIFTSTRTGSPAWQNATFNNGDLAQEISALKNQGDILVPGSIALVRSLTQLGLVDRLILHVHPVVLGVEGGRSLFEGYDLSYFKLNRTRTLDHQVVVLDYEPV